MTQQTGAAPPTGATVLRSGELARAAGVNLQTLRYYERRGLLTEPARSPGGHRLYPAGALTLLRVIKTAQRLGFTLDEVAELVDLGTHRPGRRPDRSLHRRAATKLTEIEARIADLEGIAAGLRAALDAGCDDLATCATTDCCPLPSAVPDRSAAPARRTASGRSAVPDRSAVPGRSAVADRSGRL
jgi:DNA-binding transcriptional MerR regulator